MQRSGEQLRGDGMTIWRAGVEAVDPRRLVRQALCVEGGDVIVGEERIRLDQIGRIAVVGAGKAGAGMAAAVEEVLGPERMEQKRLTGWVNVPEDILRPLSHIRLHGARPAAVNEPTAAGVAGTAEILKIVASLQPQDLCLCLISGGGSALMPSPADGITLADKLAVTRHLSGAGANIEELNVVRKQLSRVKSGGLARACRAGRLISLIISDVLGDPLEVIASGPTVADSSAPRQALALLEQFHGREADIADRVFDFLRNKGDQAASKPTARVSNLIIGNNATAVDAAGEEAVRLGYSPAMISARRSEGPAEEVGRHLAAMALAMRSQPGPDCLISGGEPVVRLVGEERRGRGGRNQQLALAALADLQDDGAAGIALIAGGTDGEDGPTDAAGAWFDGEIVSDARARGLQPGDHLSRNDAYHFFEPLNALIKTGPTGTNVCDLRIVLVDRVEHPI